MRKHGGARGDRLRSVLREVALFSALSEPLLEAVAADTREQRLARGDVLFRAGEPCAAFFCVLTGQIKLTVASGGGAVKVLEIIWPGETFAEAVMFAGRTYPVTAIALAPTRLLVVRAPTVFDLISKDPDFARLMLVGMSARLHSLVRQIAAVSLSSAAGRIADLLLSLCGSAPGPPVVVRLPAAKAVLASRLNLSPEHFSRTLRDMSGAGLILVNGRHVTLVNVEGLRALAGTS